MARTSRIAIADSFGESPDQTDDGVLYLDTSRLIALRPDAGFLVPLVTEDGTQT